MRKLKPFTIVSFSVFLGFCTPSNKASDSIIYRENSETFEKCIGDACAQVVLSYPSFEGDTLLSKQLNAQTEKKLIHYLQVEDQESPNLEGAIQGFFDAYIEYREFLAVPVQEWTLEITGKTTYHSENMLGLRFSGYSYLGGAHPNSQVSHLTFDLERAGKILTQKDMVIHEDKLLELARKAFRDFHQVDAAVSLEEDGRFFLKKGGFFLPQSMGYEQEEFVLLYNTYEIGPYSMGSTELRFPLKKLQGIVLLK